MAEENKTEKPKVIASMPQRPAGARGIVSCYPKPNGGKTYVCIFDEFVDAPDNYVELFDVLYSAKKEDTIKLLFYSCGGFVDTGIMVLHAMHNCQAEIYTVTYGLCASIAAVMWCGCKGVKRYAGPNATIMFHMPSGGNFGKTADLEEESHQVQEYFYDLLKEITDGILTDEQLKDIVMNRKDTYIPEAKLSKECCGRLEEEERDK